MSDFLFMGQQPETFDRERIYDGSALDSQDVSPRLAPVEPSSQVDGGESRTAATPDLSRDWPTLASRRAQREEKLRSDIEADHLEALADNLEFDHWDALHVFRPYYSLLLQCGMSPKLAAGCMKEWEPKE